jgi:succinoglycan biosynthesis transport protein ExoP
MTSEGNPSFGEYLATLRRRRLLMVCIALPIVLIACVLAVALPDVYRSTATFRLTSGQIADTAGESAEFADQYVLALADRVLTSTNLSGIVEQFQPYPELADDKGAAISKLRENVRVEMTVQTILEPSRGRERNINTGFTVAFDHRSPKDAQKVATALAKTFIDLDRGERLTATQDRVKFFAGESERTSREIATFEKQLADFKEKNFERLPETAQANLAIRARAEQELDNVNREIRGLEQNRVFITQQLRQAQAGPPSTNLRALEDEYARKAAVYSETHPDVVTLRRQIESLRAAGPAIGGTTLQGQLDTAKAALAEAGQRYSPDHPDVKRMQRNIESIEARIAAGESPSSSMVGESLQAVQLQTQLNALDTQIAGLRGRDQELRGRLEQFEMRLGSTPEVEREFQAITRGLDTARRQFDQMVAGRLNSEMEVAAISGGASDRFVLKATPNSPWEPVQPKRIAILVVGVILASIIALSGVVIAEVLDTRVRGAADIRQILGRSPLAVVPKIQNSLYWRERKSRLATLGVTMLVATPILYVLVYFLSR